MIEDQIENIRKHLERGAYEDYVIDMLIRNDYLEDNGKVPETALYLVSYYAVEWEKEYIIGLYRGVIGLPIREILDRWKEQNCKDNSDGLPWEEHIKRRGKYLIEKYGTDKVPEALERYLIRELGLTEVKYESASVDLYQG
jgi:hypothetical protein